LSNAKCLVVVVTANVTNRHVILQYGWVDQSI
jgi:hypothetical protein